MFMVLDGCDGVGKSTQIEMLVARLTNEGYNVKLINFPDYDNDNSTMIKRFLSGEVKCTPLLKQALYATERAVRMKQADVSEFMRDPQNILIADRYVSSSILYDTTDVSDDNVEAEISRMVRNEYVDFDTPMEDVTIMLNLSEEFVLEELGNREVTDVIEADMGKMMATIKNVKRVSEIRKYEVIQCDVGGERLTKEAVHWKIWFEVKSMIEACKGRN